MLPPTPQEKVLMFQEHTHLHQCSNAVMHRSLHPRSVTTPSSFQAQQQRKAALASLKRSWLWRRGGSWRGGCKMSAGNSTLSRNLQNLKVSSHTPILSMLLFRCKLFLAHCSSFLKYFPRHVSSLLFSFLPGASVKLLIIDSHLLFSSQ